MSLTFNDDDSYEIVQEIGREYFGEAACGPSTTPLSQPSFS